ncbi:MAG: endolytic transglycosylase MltG, partial [Atribacterota bacterium]
TVHTLQKKDLEIDSPFNTYRVMGLPPHPICNPGLSSIKAILEPAETDYLYFVLQEDGRHAFSRTYEEHLKNKRGTP